MLFTNNILNQISMEDVNPDIHIMVKLDLSRFVGMMPELRLDTYLFKGLVELIIDYCITLVPFAPKDWTETTFIHLLEDISNFDNSLQALPINELDNACRFGMKIIERYDCEYSSILGWDESTLILVRKRQESPFSPVFC